MKLYSIIAENWHSDGGACFGVVPKAIWEKNYPADEKNLVKLTNRSLLVENGKRLILIDTGFGNKRNEKYYQYQFFHGGDSLEKSLKKAGFDFEDVTDVILTHLHDDHVGGATRLDDNGNPVPVFPNAMYYCSKAQYDWAMNPNKREGASYFKDNFIPLEKAGKLQFIDENTKSFPSMRFLIANGHTQGQLVPIIDYNGKTIVYTADFIPSIVNVPIAYIPAFDTRPLLSMEEKERFLEEAANNDYYLFFEHDFFTEMCSVEHTKKGVRVAKTFTLDQTGNAWDNY